MLDKNFDPLEAEARLYKMWEDSGAFKPRMDTSREAYSIVIPPPNVTGSLHMGHAVNNTIQDILIRFERMRGKDVLWQPGMDHAGIATQMVVERKLAAAGNESRHEMGRDAFVKKVWDWKDESGGTIINQLKRLGSSCDWSRERFTLDDGLSEAVTKVFVEMYEQGLIYRAKRLVNWDPHFQTAVSNLEVENKEVDGHFWHFKYPLDGGETYEYVEKDDDGNVTLRETRDYISIATTRPETMLGDGAVAVHPDDERYAPIVGKMVRLPLANRLIPIITDRYPDPDFGSGAVKITGAHDFNDYEVAKRNDIPMYPLMDEQATMIASEIMPEKYVGMERFVARNAVVADIDAEGLLIQVEDKKIMQPVGDRSKVVIEPMLADQWFADAETLAKEAIEAVDRGHSGDESSEKGATRFVPEGWKNTYDVWMKDIQPWCISRQLWWGHRIPAWFGNNGKIYVAENVEAAQAKAGKGVILNQDEDVLDTWFSSALWPFSTLGWPDQTPELERFYPTSVLVTAFDIIFFWVARMLMQGLQFMGEVPFKDVYIHAIVRDEDGSKMSKSEGNVIDPVDLIQGIDIDTLVQKRTTGLRQPEKAPKVEKATRKRYPVGFEAYGADALRFTLAAQAAAGRDIKLSVDRVAGYRNFGTKLWNASRFAQMKECAPVHDFNPSSCKSEINQWAVSELVKASRDVTRYIEQYRFNDAAEAAYKFAWGTYCDWYLELSKPVLDGDDAAARDETRAALAFVLDGILKILHPFMPFITEEIWQFMSESRESMLIMAEWPDFGNDLINDAASDDVNWLIKAISAVRSVRSEMNIPPSKKGAMVLIGASDETASRVKKYAGIFDRMARVDGWSIGDSAPKGALQTVVEEATIALPLAGLIDLDAEKSRLSKEIDKAQSEIDKINKKLSNPNFVDRAPEAVVAEQKSRLNTFESEIGKLQAAIDNLG
ncbi:MAG: valine--tRNA ligase [Hellea sp.]|nr:valine--tRNA ligase [Hellea sp.]